jgi:hypothetical protein
MGFVEEGIKREGRKKNDLLARNSSPSIPLDGV